jgi:hypothetical protein
MSTGKKVKKNSTLVYNKEKMPILPQQTSPQTLQKAQSLPSTPYSNNNQDDDDNHKNFFPKLVRRNSEKGDNESPSSSNISSSSNSPSSSSSLLCKTFEDVTYSIDRSRYVIPL